MVEDLIRKLRRRAGPYRSHLHRSSMRRAITSLEHVKIAQAIRDGKGAWRPI